MSERLISLRGPVSVEREPHGPLGVTLAGACVFAATPLERSEPTQVAFSGAADAALPAALADVTVTRVDAGHYDLSAAPAAGATPGSARIAAHAAHVHHDVGTWFYEALPPRPVPLLKRLVLALILKLAASRAGLKLLAALRR
jgi:hypothetical protein